MSMSMVIIDDSVRKEIERIKQNAECNVTPLKVTKKLMKEGKGAAGSLNEDFTMHIPEKICVTYTHEEQPGNVICRHMSVSVSIKGRVPHPAAVQMLMEEFGFINKLNGDVIIWEENFGEETQTAINIVEPLSGNINDLRRKS